MDKTYSIKTLRESLVLTDSYVAGTTFGPQGINTNRDPVSNNQLMLYIDFTKGSLTSAELKVEFSDDGTNWYQETSSAVASGESTDSLLNHKFTASGSYRLALPLCDRHVKVSVKGTGTMTGSLMAVKAIVAYKP